MDKVFVYGTLMKGRKYHRQYLSQSTFLGKAEVRDFAMYAVSSYPGIVPEIGEKVKGEVYEVDKETLTRVDLLEDAGSLYVRKTVDVLLEGQVIPAWVYIWNRKIRGGKISYEAQPWKG
ncbi:hypothetical protein Desor_4097 [Desulfosporosinus orientis DSM 765]|uniref:Gamma-glutamylcyclotransferase family protein n=1 Tax=Desulfosporosinus orientis (strain ATCC 19365 / DSM 765 / NCIMB 8382 / VKM B-1628 / Singapore I) TaxID=768706 RepID=G7WH28_DESOD|nr:gamma-glutamylcyclotransferase family protein [Desulfosporosinus orientis]AET69536.1 hypothetical protein Desor_4097 [Desulfosporosinus orientis DSM 765]